MNKRYITLTLLVGIIFSQMPMQAGLLGHLMSASKIEALCDVVKQHPVYSLVAIGSVLGLAYLSINSCLKNKSIEDETESEFDMLFNPNNRSEKGMELVKKFVSDVIDNQPMEKENIVIRNFVIKKDGQNIKVIEPSTPPYSNRRYDIPCNNTSNKEEVFKTIQKIFDGNIR